MKVTIIKGPRFEQQKALAQQVILKEIQKQIRSDLHVSKTS